VDLVNVAVIVTSPVTVTAAGLSVPKFPLQPLNVQPSAAVVVKLTIWP
jgi:hypothetical protein